MHFLVNTNRRTFKLHNIKLFMRGEKRGQIWIETVIYTLIAFVMIGLVLTYVNPKLREMQDKSIIEQSLDIMQELDKVILDIKDVPGNKRIVKVGLKKGTLNIDGAGDNIVFEMDSEHAFSEHASTITYGAVEAVTLTKGEYHNVSLRLNYSEQYNITHNGGDTSGLISRAPIPYTLIISNDGDVGDKTIINIEFD